MKAVILAGGRGTRISEESAITPKPLIEVGGVPMLVHIMNIYSIHGVKDFIVLVGYKGHMIKEYFLNYLSHVEDITIDLSLGTTTYLNSSKKRPDWRVTVIDTGEETMTGGRLNRIRHIMTGDDHFALTYGDAVADVDIGSLEKFHLQHGKTATVTAVSPPGRFGALELEGVNVKSFKEKPLGDGAFINGGFFILNNRIFDYLDGDDCVFEQKPLQALAADGEFQAYIHNGFWQCMDTLRDKQYLEKLCASKEVPWLTKGTG